jgi:hypothetical protein
MKCSNCQHEFEYQEGMKFCPSCGHPIHPEKSATESEETLALKKPAPFEDRDNFSLVDGFINTLKEVLFNPVQFFRTLHPKGDGFMPILYAIILIFIINIVGFFFAKILGLQDMWMKIFRQYMGDTFPYNESFMTRSMISQLLMLPFLQMIALIIVAGIMHLFVIIVGANKNGFIATLRVIGYSQSASVFQLIPFVGGLIGLVYYIVLYVIGIRELHETTTNKAAWAVFLPVILCCVCVLLVFILVLIPMMQQFTNM